MAREYTSVPSLSARSFEVVIGRGAIGLVNRRFGGRNPEGVGSVTASDKSAPMRLSKLAL